MGMGGKGEPPESDKEWKVRSRWVKDCRQSGDTDFASSPQADPSQLSVPNLNAPSL